MSRVFNGITEYDVNELLAVRSFERKRQQYLTLHANPLDPEGMDEEDKEKEKEEKENDPY